MKLSDQVSNSMAQKHGIARQIAVIGIQEPTDTVNLDQNPKSVSPTRAINL